MIKQIGLPLRGRPILLITRMITDRIGLHSVLLPLGIFSCQFLFCPYPFVCFWCILSGKPVPGLYYVKAEGEEGQHV